MARILVPTLVTVLAILALAAIWRHEWLGPDDRCLAHVMGWILSAIVVIPASLALMTSLCQARPGAPARLGVACDYWANYSAIPDPYPATYKPGSITGFRYACPLHVMRPAERLPDIHPEQQYIVAEDYTIHYTLDGKEEALTVPGGTLTDLASVPRFLRWYVGRVGPHLEAAVVHDYLYVAWQFDENDRLHERMRLMRHFADDLMLAAMQQAGMGCRARLIHFAIRWGGRGIFFGRNPEPLVLDLNALGKQTYGPSAGAPHDESGTRS